MDDDTRPDAPVSSRQRASSRPAAPGDLYDRCARAEEELAARNRELEALHRISEIALSPGDLEGVFSQIAEEISVATGFPIVVIKHHDEQRRRMVLDAAHGLPEPISADALEVPLDETLSGTVVQTGQTLVEAHVWGKSAHANKTLQRLGVRTLVVVPMMVAQRVVGALTLAHPAPVELDAASLRVAASLSNFVALLTERRRAERALQQAHDELEQRVQERTSELARANEELRQEIADRRRVQAALANSEAKWRSLVENAPSAILTVDRAGKVLLASRGIGNRTAAELVGTDVFDIVRPDQRGELREALDTAFRKQERHTVEISSGGASDLRWYSVRVGPILEGGEVSGAVMIASDITEHRLLEDQLRQSSKMEAIGQLAGGVAHDFNNLLTVINGYSQFIIRRLPPDDPLRPDVEEIRQAGERAVRLTRQLLAFSRRQVLEMRVINLNEVIEGMCAMLSRVLGEDIVLDLALAPDLGAVKADPGQIEQVILNLAVNSRDAMPTGGTLSIESANVDLDEEFAAGHLGFRPGRYVRLVVSDTGCGMSAEVKAHLFEPFYTTKGPGKGTGLGLATVYGIVRQFGGSIYVYSEPDHGAVFKIYLPRCDEEAGSLYDERPRTSAELPTGDETVLVVEDKAEVRLFTVNILQRLGYTVLEAAQGSDALDVLRSRKGDVDLVLADVVMPEMSGPEFVEKLREVRSGFKVLYTSGYTDHAIVHQNLLQPGTSFIEKPYSVEALAHKVREALSSGSGY